MNLILLLPDDYTADNRVRLRGRRAAYVRAVHRATAGTRLRVGLLGDRIGAGVVTAAADGVVEMAVTLTDAPPAPLPVTLLLALPRPKSLERVLQGVAAIGIKRCVLINSWRVDKSFWQSRALNPGAVREQLILGLEQGCDTILPSVLVRPRFKPFVEDELPAMAQRTRALLAHPTASSACPHAVREPVTLAVGPEGGFTPYEVDLLQHAGFAAVSLGPRPLRVEQALPALLGRLF